MENIQPDSSLVLSPRRRRLTSLIFGIVLVVVAFAAGMRTQTIRSQQSAGMVSDGQLINKPGATVRGRDVDFALFWNVWDTLRKDYVDSGALTDKKLFYGALQGLVQSTGDPYTVFMDPQDAKDFQDDLAGTFEGIGAEIGFRDNMLAIMAPIEDMPAMKAGVRAGDKIFAIDGKSAAKLPLDDAIKAIRGPKGTKVTLTLMRDKSDKPIDITIVRDTVVVKSVKSTWREADKVYVIRVSNFNNETEKLFTEAVQDALDKKARGVILDLRNNPGGYLETAVQMASEWIPQGVIVSQEFGNKEKTDEKSTGAGRLVNMPTVVLINEGSASASEIVAGALKDYGKARLVGQKSFGKGSVQILKQLPDGSVVKVTTAKWLTPKGSYIHEKGIEPDVAVERSVEDRQADKDPQFDQALKEFAPKK